MRRARWGAAGWDGHAGRCDRSRGGSWDVGGRILGWRMPSLTCTPSASYGGEAASPASTWGGTAAEEGSNGGDEAAPNFNLDEINGSCL